MTQANPQQCMTIREVAAILRVAVSTVYVLIKTKELKALTVKGKYRVRRYDLDRFLDRAQRVG